MAVFTWDIRVYYEDTDAGGVVYYANYLRFLERARTEWLRQFGFEQDQIRDEFNALFVVRHVTIDFKQAARFNQQLSVSVIPEKINKVSFTVQQDIVCNNVLINQAHVKVACINSQTFKPQRMPAALFNLLTLR